MVAAVADGAAECLIGSAGGLEVVPLTTRDRRDGEGRGGRGQDV